MATVRSGSSPVLVLRWEAGVGKTVLLGPATAMATGFRCIEVAGVRSEMECAFAAMQH